jgi:hypothetical protein
MFLCSRNVLTDALESNGAEEIFVAQPVDSDIQEKDAKISWPGPSQHARFFSSVFGDRGAKAHTEARELFSSTPWRLAPYGRDDTDMVIEGMRS